MQQLQSAAQTTMLPPSGEGGGGVMCWRRCGDVRQLSKAPLPVWNFIHLHLWFDILAPNERALAAAAQI